MSPFWVGVIRRFVAAPVLIVLTLALLITAPLWLIVVVLLSPLFPGRLRALRLISMAMLHLILESALLLVMFGLWIISGFGWKLRSPAFERTHYLLIKLYLKAFFAETRRVLGLELVVDGDHPDLSPGHPLLVCPRHAGPGDSFTIMYALMTWFHREPRIVLKDSLAWDPAIGVALNRLPARFISSSPPPGVSVEDEVGALAHELDGNDAFVIFPEGGNFTPGRRERGIARLRERGLDDMADQAEALTNTLAPRPGGLLAALENAPEADVVIVAHTGLDHLVTLRDLWREVATDKQLIMRWWCVPRAEIPEDRDGRIAWIYAEWATLDAWVEENKVA